MSNINSASNYEQLLRQLPRAAGEPAITAGFRQRPEDFFVQELIDFEFAGEGDHLCVLIEKTGLNTHEIIERLVAVLGIKSVDIGYFGLKDRQAVTQQWFSIHLPGKSHVPVDLALGEGVAVLEQTRHTRKFRVGSHKGNRFAITLRELDGDIDHFQNQLSLVYEKGFPNYFAEQRFGFGAQNINRALTMFRAAGSARRSPRITRQKRSIYLSAVRGFLFNLLLAERVREANWLTPLNDEKLILAGSHSFFEFNPELENIDAVHERLMRHDIHTSGVLWGRGDDITSQERLCLQPFSELTEGLESAGLKVSRRALRASVEQGNIEWQSAVTAKLEFELPVGSYATSLLREVCLTVDARNAADTAQQ